MLQNEAYFTRVDSCVRRSMFQFADARQKLRLDPANMAMQATLIGSASDLLRLGFETCGIPAPETLTSLADFSRGVGKLAGTEVAKDDLRATCFAELGKLLAAAGLQDGDGRLPAQAAPLSTSALEFVVEATGILCRSLFGLYAQTGGDPSLATAFFTAAGVEARIPAGSLDLLRGLPARLAGWCSYDKAALLYMLVRKYRPEKVVEIGVFGGRSIVPMALALRDNGSGHVVGIESWAVEPIATFRTSLANDFWWATTDFAGVKHAFLSYVVLEKLHPYIRLMETTSDRGLAVLDEIQFAHIDGGHSMVGAAQDVAAVLSKMPPGGVIVFDDVNWRTTRPALELLQETCRLLHVVANNAEPPGPGSAVFIKR